MTVSPDPVVEYPQTGFLLDTVLEKEGPESFQRLAGVLGEIDQMCDVSVPDFCAVMSPNIDALAILLATLRRYVKVMQDAAAYVEDELVKVMPGKQAEVPGLGVIEMRTGSARKGWDKEGLTHAMVHSIAAEAPNLIDATTGELVNLVDHINEVIGRYQEAATPSWKTTGLRAHGIDPEDYCETTWGRKTIQTPQVG